MAVDSRDPIHARGPKSRGNTAVGIATALAVHGALALTILGAAWGVSVARRERETPVVLTADFFNPAPTRAPSDARTAPQPADAPTSTAWSSATAAPTAALPELAERLRALEARSAPNAELDALARRFGAGDRGDGVEQRDARQGASFAGLVSGNATKVAYVVDASGSMIGSFSAIVDEVERSIARLEPTQRFTVICFRRDGAVCPQDICALRAASRAERNAAVAWLRDDVVPSGRSSPVEALTKALQSGADCIFLLSTTITGPGRHELDKDGLLALLERLNPRDASTGQRRTTIQCIQFLESDPGRALEAVAAEHFGAGGYRFLSRDDAGFGVPKPPNEIPSNQNSSRSRNETNR
jgi:hypothetical protein